MTASRGRTKSANPRLPRTLPKLELHHGEALWVLSHLGFRGSASKATFYEYIKSLRRLGTPFDRGTIGYVRRGLANYSYSHLMELALILTLRVYNVVPDVLIAEIVKHRLRLYVHYRRAYAERASGLGTSVAVSAESYIPIRLQGIFLDLQLDFSGGKLTAFGPPKLLSPFDALITFAKRDVAARALLPINLSLLSERLVSAALQAPTIQRGLRGALERSQPRPA
jgi:hypothetical protein